MERNLTSRQQEIKDRLEQRMSARDIASDLGISRNAVYQQIQALRKKGSLSPNFTPSGTSPREVGALVGMDEAGMPIAAQLIRTISDVADQLERMAADLRSQVS